MSTAFLMMPVVVLMWLNAVSHYHLRQQDLFSVLKAYTLHRPEEGYCQAQAPIAAVLLMHMPAEVNSTFLMLFSVI